MAVVGQTSELSCGAACLLCAALELNKVPSVANLGALGAARPLHILISSGTPLAATNAWLSAIYDVSGGGRRAIHFRVGLSKLRAILA